MINQNERQRPKPFIDKALEYFKERNGEIIVEIGSMRMDLNHDINDFSYPCCNDGHSSVILAKAAKEFYTVDIDYNTANLAYNNLCKYINQEENKFAVCQLDGLKFLQMFEGKIDLLFLDAWDVGSDCYAENHLEAYQIAKKNLHEKSLILIDNTDVIERNGELFLDNSGISGKGRLVIPQAVKDGYKIMFSGRQVLLMKEV